MYKFSVAYSLFFFGGGRSIYSYKKNFFNLFLKVYVFQLIDSMNFILQDRYYIT